MKTNTLFIRLFVFMIAVSGGVFLYHYFHFGDISAIWLILLLFGMVSLIASLSIRITLSKKCK
ncbi:hypothetical protein [Bacillus sp. 1P06AnD]|uniref:hypothetical protein n=1 Tax=Bacillus sp. 1P06AnD TaxID=3132208 RepID=UPI0039A09705